MLHPPDLSSYNWVDPLGTVVSGYPGFGSHWRVNLSRGSDSSLNVWTVSKYCIVLYTLHANAKTPWLPALKLNYWKPRKFLLIATLLKSANAASSSGLRPVRVGIILKLCVPIISPQCSLAIRYCQTWAIQKQTRRPPDPVGELKLKN